MTPTLVFRMAPEGRCEACGKLGRTELTLNLCWACCGVYLAAYDRLRLLSERFSSVVWPCVERSVSGGCSMGHRTAEAVGEKPGLRTRHERNDPQRPAR